MCVCDAEAWLSDSVHSSSDLQGANFDELEQQQQLDIEVCRKMHATGWAMIDVVTSYGQEFDIYRLIVVWVCRAGRC